MDLQKSIIKKFNHTFQNPPLRLIAKLTGIQISRVFRIINGHPMKLEEYVTFKRLVESKSSHKEDLVALATDCNEKLSETSLDEIKTIMKRKLQLKSILAACIRQQQTVA